MRRLLARPLLPTILCTMYYVLTPAAHAATYQSCAPSESCTIGEYLYDDEYQPLTGAICTVSAKYPDGTTYLNNQSMTGSSDGWYKYDASLGTTTGLYRANVCCTTPDSQYLCLDKSFEVAAPSSTLTAADVWNYSGRTLSSYGTLISDIWNYGTRSLTTFGSLITDIWGSSTRTLTAFGNLPQEVWNAEPSSLPSLAQITKEQQSQRILLEKLVNEPVVTLSLEDNELAVDLTEKLQSSKKQADALADTVSTAKSKLLSLDTNWNKLGTGAKSSEIASLTTTFTSPEPLATLTTDWNADVLTSVSENIDAVKSSLVALRRVSSTSLTPPELTKVLENIQAVELALGDITSPASEESLYGYLTRVEEQHGQLESERQKLATYLDDWDGQGESILRKRLTESEGRILALNQYPGGESILATQKTDKAGKDGLKNLVFRLQGLLGLNKQLLASSANAPLRGLWLEEGSIIFRAVITNPSSIVSQDASLKFFLPAEIKAEDIIFLDPSLTSVYDTDHGALAVTGTYPLKPLGTEIVAVEVNDIWVLDEREIERLRSEVQDLVKPLEGTSYHASGLTIKNSVESALSELVFKKDTHVKPENRIRAYREARLKLAQVGSEVTELHNLVALAESNQAVIGFVGGVSTTAVFGIILVVVAGFIFLARYFQTLNPVKTATNALEIKETTALSVTLPTSESPAPTPLLSRLDRTPAGHPVWQTVATYGVVIITTVGSTIFLTSAARRQQPPVVNQVTVASPSPSPAEASRVGESPSPSSTPTPSSQPTLTLTVPEDSSVNIRNRPSSDGDILMAIKESVDVVIFKESDDWRQIGFSEADSTKGYWVHAQFIAEP